MVWAGHVARMEEMRNALKIVVGKSDWKKQLGRPRRSWGDNIKMDLREVIWEIVDRIHLARECKVNNIDLLYYL